MAKPAPHFGADDGSGHAGDKEYDQPRDLVRGTTRPGPGKNELSTYTLRAGEAIPIGMGSDAVEAYPVEVEGAGRPLIFQLRATAPHLLVRISPPGSPIEVVRSGADSN